MNVLGIWHQSHTRQVPIGTHIRSRITSHIPFSHVPFHHIPAKGPPPTASIRCRHSVRHHPASFAVLPCRAARAGLACAALLRDRRQASGTGGPTGSALDRLLVKAAAQGHTAAQHSTACRWQLASSGACSSPPVAAAGAGGRRAQGISRGAAVAGWSAGGVATFGTEQHPRAMSDRVQDLWSSTARALMVLDSSSHA
jgi:hypothetical protein